jgi:hypothetical protein
VLTGREPVTYRGAWDGGAADGGDGRGAPPPNESSCKGKIEWHTEKHKATMHCKHSPVHLYGDSYAGGSHSPLFESYYRGKKAAAAMPM